MLLLCIVETGPGFKFRSVATIRMKLKYELYLFK